ncbi:hypothetical protein [Aphanizomenon flos-aquae]|nr:hypothetical protein [Aphanizomenon flos-aquae]
MTEVIFQLPITNYQLPITNYQLPITIRHFGIINDFLSGFMKFAYIL